jgi:hypothetical protein
MKAFFAGYVILERFNRIVRQIPLDDRANQARLDYWAERLMRALGRYNATLEVVDERNLKGRTRREMESIVLKLLLSHMNDEDLKRVGMRETVVDIGVNPDKAEEIAIELYGKIAESFEKMGIIPDMVCVAAWFGFNWALGEAYKAAYESYRLLIGDVTESSGWKRFHASHPEYRRYFLDTQFESTAGDQSVSIDMKQTFHLINYAAYSNRTLDEIVVDFRKGKGREEKAAGNLLDLQRERERGRRDDHDDEEEALADEEQPQIFEQLLGMGFNGEQKEKEKKETFTLAEVFELAALVDCLGWLKENRDIGIEIVWERVHYIWQRVYSTVRNPLMDVFLREIVNIKQKPFKTVLQYMERYDAPFQVVDGDAWKAGVLPGKVRLSPVSHDFGFYLMSVPDRANIKYMAMGQGAGKTTLIGSFVCLSVLREKAAVFMPLSDNFNWPTLAFMPQTEIKIHNSDRNPVYKFNRDLGITPRGIPTLILNIVRSLDDLRGIRMTKYDRVILVRNHESFFLDFDRILEELKVIASEPEFDMRTPSGLVAVRYMGRSGISERTHKMFDVELQNATNFLRVFTEEWRSDHMDIPVRISVDEAAEAAATATESRDQAILRSRMEKHIRSARRFNVPTDFASQLVKDLSQKVRAQIMDTFWKNLSEGVKKSTSEHDVLLASLGIDQETQKAVKQLQRDPNFANSRLVFWHNAMTKEVRLVQPVPPPFMCQAKNLDIQSIYRIYLKRREIQEEKFFPSSPQILMGYGDTSEDSEEEDDEEAEGEERQDGDQGETWTTSRYSEERRGDKRFAVVGLP